MIDIKEKSLSFESSAVHAGSGKKDQYGSHTTPIYQTSTFVFNNVDEGAKAFAQEEGGASHIYSRLGNPTVEHLERAICELETYGLENGAEYTGMAFGSGMAAITTGIISFAKEKHIIAQDALYGCTSQFLKEETEILGMSTSFIDMTDLFLLEMELKKNPNTALIYLESIANPTMKVSDIEAISKLAKEYNALVMVDNTFATPYHMQPLKLGADIVVHSTTKYMGGHGTIVGGALVAKKELLDESGTYLFRKNLGGISGPMDAWITMNGVKTLALRMKQHSENAMKVAEFLESHSSVETVWYPGLKSHAQHTLADSIMRNGFGGVIAFELKKGFEAGKSLMNNVRLCTLAVSLGTVDTLIQHPASMTHSVMNEELRCDAGITDGLVRLSVGIESAEDIIADLEQALSN
ncbi:MAG: PLP-dependent transferase [Balneola sp.]